MDAVPNIPRKDLALAQTYYCLVMQARRVVTAASVGVQSGWDQIYAHRLAILKCLESLSDILTPLPPIDLRELRSPYYDPFYPLFAGRSKTPEVQSSEVGPVASITRTYFIPNRLLFYLFHGEAIRPEYLPDSVSFIGYEELARLTQKSERITAYDLDWVIKNLSSSGDLYGNPERLVDCVHVVLRLLAKATKYTSDQRKIDQIFREVQTIEAEQRRQADETYLREEAILQKILEALIDRIREAYYPLPRLVYAGRTQDIAIPRRYRIICCDTRQKKLIYFGSRTNRELAWWDKLTHCILRDRTATRNDIAQVVGELGDRLLVAALPEELHTEIINTVDSGCEGVNLEQWR